jgi:uncharacterized membrane protein YqaE (UPF0057 family)
MIKNLVCSFCFLFLFIIVEPLSATKPVEIKPSDQLSLTLKDISFDQFLADFKHLNKQEKKSRIKDVKAEIRKFNQAKKDGFEADTNLLLLAILAILLPPLAVYLYEGEINNRFWISLLLTLLFWLPGVIYALILILGNY